MANPTALGVRPQVRTATTINMEPVPVVALDWANGIVVAAGAASAASAVIDASNDRIVEASSNTDCWIKIGTTPTAVAATAGNAFLAGGSVRYLYVPAGMKVAAIQSSASGTVGLLPAVIST